MCTCVHVHVEARGKCMLFPPLLWTLFLFLSVISLLINIPHSIQFACLHSWQIFSPASSYLSILGHCFDHRCLQCAVITARLIFWGRVSQPEAYQLCQAGWPGSSRDLVTSASTALVLKLAHHDFCVSAGDWTLVLILYHKHFVDWAIPPISILAFYFEISSYWVSQVGLEIRVSRPQPPE